MTIDHPLRRFLARVCSADTMARVVDPTLADLRWESGRLTCRGCLALLRALTVHAVLSTPLVLSRAWSDDDHAIPKVAGYTLAAAAVGVMLLELPTFALSDPLDRNVSETALALLVAPQALILALPAALLVAIPLAFRKQEPSRRLAGRVIALSLCAVTATFVLMMWVVPETNHAFRVMANGPLPNGHQLARGPAEEGLAAMRERIEVMKLNQRYGDGLAARRLEFDYHLRFVLPCLPLPLGVLALAIARSDRGRRRPWLMGLTALAGYSFVYFPMLAGAGTLVRGSSLPPFIFAWVPFLLLAIVATTLLRRLVPEPA